MLLAIGLVACQAPTQTTRSGPDLTRTTSPDSSRYRLGARSYDGIGKYYMGREISEVMGHLGAGWLERPEREQEEKGSLLIDNMKLAPDAIVADIGAGTGYFSFQIAERVPQGKVLAVDIQPEMLDYIAQKQATSGVTNIEGILGTEQDPKLPVSKVDAVLMVDVYHEFSYPYEMMQAIRAALSPEGRVFLIEYRGEDPAVPIKPRHKMTAEQAIKEMEAAGLVFIENLPPLPRQHLLVFGLKK